MISSVRSLSRLETRDVMRIERRMSEEPISVLLVDKFSLLRACIEASAQESDVAITFTSAASTADTAIEVASRERPEAIVLSSHDPSEQDSVATFRSSFPHIRILVIASYSDPESVCRALQDGADGFVPVSVSAPEIVEAIVRVANGQSVIHPETATAALMWRIRGPQPTGPLSTLTKREAEVLRLLGTGLDNTQIAAHMFISRRTVEGHLASTYRKLGVHNRVQAFARFSDTDADRAV